MKEHIIRVDEEACIGCGMCVKDCPQNNLNMVDKKAAVRSQDCMKCGHCLAICPKAAVSFTGFEEPPIEIEKPTMLEPERLLGAIRTRRTVRQFTSQPVADEIVEQIIEAGRWTPSGKNAQNVSYLVLKGSMEHCEKIAVQLFRKLLPVAKLVDKGIRHTEIDNSFFFKKAGAVIVLVSKDKVNAALAASNMELMAQAHGLGVLYSGLFAMAARYSGKLRRELGLHRGERVVTALVLGYPGVAYRRTAQKDAAEVRYV